MNETLLLARRGEKEGEEGTPLTLKIPLSNLPWLLWQNPPSSWISVALRSARTNLADLLCRQWPLPYCNSWEARRGADKGESSLLFSYVFSDYWRYSSFYLYTAGFHHKTAECNFPWTAQELNDWGESSLPLVIPHEFPLNPALSKSSCCLMPNQIALEIYPSYLSNDK